MKIVMESRRWGHFPHRFRVLGVPVTVLSINFVSEIVVRGELRKYYGVTCAVFGDALLYCDESNTVWHLVRQRSNTACTQLRIIMHGMQQIRAYFPEDIGAMLSGLSMARPDLDEAWSIVARQVGFKDPATELGIGKVVVINSEKQLSMLDVARCQCKFSVDVSATVGEICPFCNLRRG